MRRSIRAFWSLPEGNVARVTARMTALVSGRVQGVGFRYWAHHTAERLPGITGVVRNLPDGTVEVEAESPERTALDVLFHELHVGPTHAQVTAVDAEWEENVAPRYASGFRVA